MKRDREGAGVRLRARMVEYVRHERAHADEMAAQFKADDELWPPISLDPQAWSDWTDFARKVCVPLVEADGDEAKVQPLLAEFRKANAHYLALVGYFGLRDHDALNEARALIREVVALFEPTENPTIWIGDDLWARLQAEARP